VNVIPLHRPVRQVIAQARNLLAGLMDADLPQAAALAVCQAYNHLEAADDALWPPPQPSRVGDPQVALDQVQGLLHYAVDHPGPDLNPYDLGWALRETAAAIVLMHRPGGAT
jgi:hypothetical protein